MKQLFYLFLVLFLFGCDDLFLDTSHYTQTITQSKEYSVYLDMSEIGNIQVKANEPLAAPFKILSNDRYYFVGERLKGMHVYEKKAAGVSYLCFIECSYMTDLELTDNLLFCNNLVDLVVVDVSNPMEIKIVHRQKNHFNRFTSYKQNWNLPYEAGKGYIVGYETHQLRGTITDEQPHLDFSELDHQYGHLTTKEIPGTWFIGQPGNERPSPGMISLGTDEIYTYGSYNSWAICAYRSGAFSVREADLWTQPWGHYAPPYYYSNAYPVRMFLEDSIIFVLGAVNNLSGGYADCILYNEQYPLTHQLWFPAFQPLDICYLPTLNAFFALSGNSVWGIFISGDGVTGFQRAYKDYQVATDAVEIFRVGDQLITLGDELSVYAVSANALSLVKQYPGISGICCKKEGNRLTVANTQGLFLYDMTDLENIQQVP